MAIQVNGGLNILVEESYLLQATHKPPFLTKNKYNQNEKWNYFYKIVRLKAWFLLTVILLPHM
jgi:hypothetical protein